jgi:pimeloyl-ACP methyl ester carboxylesterase
MPEVREFEFESRGTRLFGVEQGEGRPIILLHGGVADHLASVILGRTLGGRHHLITPDLRASGRSVYAGELGWDLLADDLAALMRRFELPRAVIGGTSMGSAVALRFALHHPSAVAGLVLVAPVYRGAALGFTPTQAATMEVMDCFGRRALASGVGALRPLYERLPEPARALALAMLERFDAASLATTTAFLASLVQPFEDVAELQRVTAPALIVPGTDDQHPPDVADLYAQHLPQRWLAPPGEVDLSEVIGDFCDRHARW